MVEATIPQERCDFYVYAIFRQDGDVCYIGKGRGGRWKDHVRRSHNRRLSRIYAKAGGDLPIIKVRECITNADAILTEIALIDAIGRSDQKRGPLVNLTDGGEGVRGLLYTDDLREKRRIQISGRSPEWLSSFINGGRKARLGSKATAGTLEKLRLSHVGFIRTKESIQKAADKNRGKKRPSEAVVKTAAWHRGRKRSPETCAKISAVQLGKKKSPETVANMSAGQLGRKHSPETIAKTRTANLGRKHSPKARTNMSVGRQQAYAEKIRAEAGPWLIDPGPEFRARADTYHEKARRMASRPVEQMSLNL